MNTDGEKLPAGWKDGIGMETRYIQVGGRRMSTQLLGEVGSLIVLLHGGGVLAPVLEFGALSRLLAVKHRVLVVELFGYGLSDGSGRERTIENIVAELHEVIAAHGRRYVLMGHSISGVYALYYANRYPGEVAAFVGLDTSVPRQNDVMNVLPLNIAVLRATRLLRRAGLLRLLAGRPSAYLPDIDTVDWSPGERELFRRLFLENSANDTVLNELQNGERNFEAARGLRFPETVPVLCILSRQTCGRVKAWRGLHAGIIRERERSRILLCGGPHFLHYTHPRQIAGATLAWLRSCGL